MLIIKRPFPWALNLAYKIFWFWSNVVHVGCWTFIQIIKLLSKRSRDFFKTWKICFRPQTCICACVFVLCSPEWSPMRILTLTSGMCTILNVPMQCRMSRDMLAISAAWRLELRFGTPDATMYASPIVSTCWYIIKCYLWNAKLFVCAIYII